MPSILMLKFVKVELRPPDKVIVNFIINSYKEFLGTKCKGYK